MQLKGFGSSLPVLTYHSIGPGALVGADAFEAHLTVLAGCGLPSLSPSQLDTAARGFLLTFDDGFADLWTHGLSLLKAHKMRAVVFAIASRPEEGPARPRGEWAYPGSATQALGEAARHPSTHPGFCRWSELEALEASGLVEVQSHSFEHQMAWVGEEIAGFHLGPHGKRHWSLPYATGGDERLGIPRYRRGSILAFRRYFDDAGLRDVLASWLEGRGGESYIREKGADAVTSELREVAHKYQVTRRSRGRWETEEEREARALEDIVRAKETLERRLGGSRDELCLPWGHYDGVTLECARKAGIRRVYTTERGANPAGRVGFLVNRFAPIRRANGPGWLRSRLWIYRSTFRATVYARWRI